MRGPQTSVLDLPSLFEGCPFPVLVEQDERVLYRNPCLQSRLASGAAGDLSLAVESARWQIELDCGPATVKTYAFPAATSELKLRDTERLLRETPIGLAIIDEEMRYREINQSMADLNGLPIEAHLEKTISQVLPHIAPHLEPILQNVLATGESVLGLELDGPDWKHAGIARHTLVSFLPFQGANYRGVQASVIEVTPIKEVTNRLASQLKIFEQVHDSVIQSDLEGRITSWNRGAEQTFGYTADEVRGQHVSILYFEEDRPQIYEKVLQPLLANGQHEVVLRNRRKDGSECWIRLSLSLVRDASGQPFGMVGYSEDITRRLRAERALQESESRYRHLFESSPVGIAVWRPDGTLLQANAVFLDMAELSRREVAEGTAVCKMPAALACRTQKAVTVEDEWVRRDGSRLPVLIGSGERQGPEDDILAFVLDLSAQKAAEQSARESREALELAMEGAEVGAWSRNLLTDEIRFNDRWMRALGYKNNELRCHVSQWMELIHPDDLPHTLEAVRAHLAGETPLYEAEYRVRSTSGEWRWNLSRGKIIERQPDGTPLCLAGTRLDTTARKQAELALARSEQRFHAIFDQTFQFMALLDRNGIVIEFNRSALIFGGCSAAAVMDRHFADISWWGISTQTQQTVRDSIARAAAGEFIRYEVEVWSANRTAVTIDFSLRPIRDASGSLDLIIAEGRDITDLKRAQQLLHAEGEKRRLEAVLRSMTKGVVIADPAGKVLSMNPAALQLLGINENQARRGLFDFTDFELRQLDGVLLPVTEWPLARGLRGERIINYELEVRKLDTGHRFIASFGAAPVKDETGQLILVVLTFRDTTHAHDVESALRQSNYERDVALQAGRMEIWRREYSEDADPFVWLAPIIVFGSRPPKISSLDSVHPDDLAALRRFCERMTAGECEEVEYRLAGRNGEYRWRASRGQIVRSDQEQVTGWAGVTWDITDRKRTEAEIERMNGSLHKLSGELLRSQDAERRRLSRELHDGPVQLLTAAAMNLAILARSPQLKGSVRESRLAEECLSWVKQCSEDMRSLSYVLHPPNLDELGLTAALRGWIAGFADRTGMELDIHLEEVGRMDGAMETGLFRIVQEALINAHRHSRGSSAAVRMYQVDGLIRLEVHDNGCGMAPGILEGRGVGGILGVGLQGMRERALQLGGALHIDSQSGRGTRVDVAVPAESPK